MIEQVLIAIGWFVSGFVLGVAFTKFCRSQLLKIRRNRLLDDIREHPLLPYQEGDLVEYEVNSYGDDLMSLEREREDRF